jgi:outer membrane lipoprotein-sorting protein
MDFDENTFARIIERTDHTLRPEHQALLRQRALEVFDRARIDADRPTFLPRSPTHWRWIMRSPISRVTAAAIFIFAIAGVALWFHGGGATSALADFSRPILEAKTAKFKSTVEIEGKAPVTSQAMFLAPNRFRYERPESILICQPDKMLTLDPKEKRALITNYVGGPKDLASKNWFEELRTHLIKAQNDPTVKHEAIGEKQFGGATAVGYRFTDLDKVITLWGDPKTGLPIRVEHTFVNAPESKSIMTDFVFDAALDESLFSIEPPAGYSVFRNQVDASAPGEKDLIDSLRHYSDLFGGAFPDSFVVNDKTMNPVMEKIFVKKGWKMTAGMKPNQEQMQILSESLLRVGRGFTFAASLPPEADAHYAGKGVSLGAADAPIFWYRPKDAKKYRVLYADLSIHEMDAPPKVSNAQPAKPGPKK